jgi:hypothetical protein
MTVAIKITRAQDLRSARDFERSPRNEERRLNGAGSGRSFRGRSHLRRTRDRLPGIREDRAAIPALHAYQPRLRSRVAGDKIRNTVLIKISTAK